MKKNKIFHYHPSVNAVFIVFFALKISTFGCVAILFCFSYSHFAFTWGKASRLTGGGGGGLVIRWQLMAQVYIFYG